MRKILFYYSLTGNAKLVASKLKELDNEYELRELKTKRKMPKAFFFRVLTGGFLAGIGKKDKLVDVNLEVSEEDQITIVSPIWNGRTVPAVNGLLNSCKFIDTNLNFVFTSGSGELGKAKTKLNKLYPNSDIICLKEPLQYSDELNKLKR